MNNNHIGYRTYKDLIDNRFQYVQPTRFMAFIAELLSYAINFPIIGQWLSGSFAVICTALSRLRRQGEYGKLYDLLLKVLLKSTFRNQKTYRWWYLMRFAVAVTQERQINWLIRDIVLEDNLMILGTLGPRPLTGYDVAYTFVGYSLWLFERGDVAGAINMIKLSVNADKTWGYPEYLHGWFGLFTTGIDSVEHFTRAVHTDWSFLQRMKHDKTCLQYPEILKEVHKRTLVAK